MSVTRNAARSAPGPSGDPLARVGRQLIAAERRLRHRRARRRIAAGTATGALLLVALVVALLPGGPLGGEAGTGGDRAPSLAGGRGASGGERAPSRDGGAPALAPGRLRVTVAVGDGAQPDATVLARVRARLAAVGFPDARVRAEGARIVAETAWARGRGSHANQRMQIAALLGEGQLSVYDWEASAVSADGRPAAGRRDGAARAISGGGGGQRAGMALPAARAAAARAAEPVAIVQALAAEPGRPVAREDPRARFYVLSGAPALTGADVRAVGATTGAGGRPAVRLALRPAAQERFHALTRAISQRGQSLALPGSSAAAAAQHYALVLDGRLLAVAPVDPLRLPDGLDGRRGVALEDGFTRSRAAALATGLGAQGGPLPPLSLPRFEQG